MKNIVVNHRWSAVVLALGALCGPVASAQTAQEELQQLRATTQALINTLVESGLLTREKAAAMLKQVQPSASSTPAAPVAAATAPAAEVGSDGKRVVRVPYVSESVRQEMREQIKAEVLTQAKTERWGQANAYPEWLSRFQFDGDLRVREEAIRLGADNTKPEGFRFGEYTRAADFATSSASSNGLPNSNTQSDLQRSRVRARLGVGSKVSDEVSVGLRLSTGSSTASPTSTNQTMGQSFNKYAVVLDRVYLELKPVADVRLMAGRINNPFYSTDLVYADDLGFEGFAAHTQRHWQGGEAFATAGYFPLTESKPGVSNSRSLVGLQLGNALKLANQDEWKVGLALYTYQGMAGARETDDVRTSQADYAIRYEYGNGFRQRGNTLFRVNAPSDTASVYGLASEFKVLNLTTALSLNHLTGQPITVTGDFVKNLAFDAQKIAARTGSALGDGKDTGLMVRAAFGPAQVHHKGQWNASMAYRYLGSDAVLDAFTNSDFGLGGTNNKGWILQTSYGLYNNTWLTARWLSANQLDSFAPGAVTKFSSDIFQLDLNARF